jgi:hypothetical protein
MFECNISSASLEIGILLHICADGAREEGRGGGKEVSNVLSQIGK